MMDAQQATNGPQTGALQGELEGLLVQGQIVAVRLGVEREVTAAGVDLGSPAIWYD